MSDNKQTAPAPKRRNLSREHSSTKCHIGVLFDFDGEYSRRCQRAMTRGERSSITQHLRALFKWAGVEWEDGDARTAYRLAVLACSTVRRRARTWPRRCGTTGLLGRRSGEL